MFRRSVRGNMNSVQVQFERWVLPKVVQHLDRVTLWLMGRLWIHLDLDQDRWASISSQMRELNHQLFSLELDVWNNVVRYHTPEVSSLIADYLFRSHTYDPELGQKIHEAIQREREERTRGAE